MSVTVPKGFRAAGCKAGIKPSGKPDLCLIVRDAAPPGVIAGSAVVLTTNQVLGAPVIVAKVQRAAMLKSNAALRAVVVNAGNSNAATGEAGVRAAEATMAAVAGLVGCEPDAVLPSSTGVIGRVLPVRKILEALPALHAALGRGPDADTAAAGAIMTTDLVPKAATQSVEIDGRLVSFGAIAKGSGMIAPRLDSASGPPTPSATMLAFVTTDAAISTVDLQRLVDDVAAGTFNRISVDNHPSCSDTLCVLASGLAEPASGPGGAKGAKPMAPIARGSAGARLFADALHTVCEDLAKQIVVDGEGATRVFHVSVAGARTAGEAEAMAREIVNSPLVKCAIHGRDPNWGRIVTAAGNAGVRFDPTETSLSIGPVEVYRAGVPIGEALTDPRLAEAMAGKEVAVRLTVGGGPGSGWMMGCDLSAQYVSINADYTT